MALPATDTFTGTGALSGSWTNETSGAGISRISDQAIADGTTNYNFAYWNADAFSSDQYSKATLIIGSSGEGIVIVRAITGDKHYGFHTSSSGNSFLFLLNGAGSFTNLQSFGIVAVSGNTIEIRVSGTGGSQVLRCYVNGVQVGTDTSDATLSGGSAGIGARIESGVDNWEGGNLGGGGGGPVIPVFMNQYTRQRNN